MCGDPGKRKAAKKAARQKTPAKIAAFKHRTIAIYAVAVSSQLVGCIYMSVGIAKACSFHMDKGAH
jgi:hypothetical protein